MTSNSLRTGLLLCLLALVAAPSASAFRKMDMGIHDPGAGGGNELAFQRMADARATIARDAVIWGTVAPGGTTKPAGFDPRNPGDPAYNWGPTDAFVRAAAARGMDPLLTVYSAPGWAEGDDADDRARRIGDGGTYHPNAEEYGHFMHAIATRYSGSYTPPGASGPLPRVKYFQAWNEPNFGQYLSSRSKGDIPVYYVRLLNAAYDAVKGVSSSNLVIAAGMGPFGNNGHATDVEPQQFMRSMMCLTGKGGQRLRAKRGCAVPKAKFDVWSQHPYTFAGKPTTEAFSADGAALGDMPEVVRTLKFAVRKGKVFPRRNKRLWVTEFAWFSNPPGYISGGRQIGLPLSRHAEYLSESAYRLWRQGFSAFVWYSLLDTEGFPAGLFRGAGADATPKPAFAAFQLPFYADHGRGGVLVWGIAPQRAKTTVRIERRSGSRWRRVVDLSTDSRGMFYDRVRGSRGTYRARSLGAGSGSAQSQEQAYTDPSRPFKAR